MTYIVTYRFILISVSSISSDTVMIFEFDWKPRCVMIMSENWSAMSTFDISSAEVVSSEPISDAPLMVRVPELFDS